ncbi:hypothetical protein BaRGS_00009749 [Batillaria attramentaria]|uniref:GH16 domain-containing protein n=1 Tax=Batillaria attramentaria TaxID=370345 RepID=A0ABD0LHR8_9CAEN
MTIPSERMRGPVIFREDFSGSRLDLNSWKYEVSLFGGMNWEFQVYTPQEENVFLKGGNLFLKPTLTIYDQKFDENFLSNGKMDASEIWGMCTNSGNYGCVREGRYGLLPPIMSGKIMSRPTIRFGTVEVRARIPKGDWIWPAIWMMPKDSAYGGWPRSGEIDIMESRGNLKALAADGKNHGTDEVGSTLHWGRAWNNNFYHLTHEEKFKPRGESWHNAFHTWRLDWTPEGLVTYVDDEEVLRVTPPAGGFYELARLEGDNLWSSGTKMAPFDQDFYLILNVAVGGTIGYFDDSWDYGVTKPWNNTSPQAAQDFWNKRDEWESTWHGDDVAMEVDYVEFRHL